MSDLPPARPTAEPWVTRGDLRFAAVTIAALAVAGALAGLVWGAWSRTATRGLVYTKTAIIPDQTEGFISSDGRFAAITAVIGLVAGALVWRWRGARGPFTVAALAVGCALGAFLTDLVGRLIGGGTTSGTVGTVLRRLPLEVHASGLVFLEALLAVGLYVVFAAFINPDDLGRDRVDVDERGGSTALVGATVDLQQPGRDRDAAGAPEQDDLAPE
jgi:Protein of unknown function (DUF2567)